MMTIRIESAGDTGEHHAIAAMQEVGFRRGVADRTGADEGLCTGTTSMPWPR